MLEYIKAKHERGPVLAGLIDHSEPTFEYVVGPGGERLLEKGVRKPKFCGWTGVTQQA